MLIQLRLVPVEATGFVGATFIVSEHALQLQALALAEGLGKCLGCLGQVSCRVLELRLQVLYRLSVTLVVCLKLFNLSLLGLYLFFKL